MRKTVKKLTAVGLTVTSVLGLVACGSSKGTTSQGTSENKEVTKPDTFTVMCDGTVVTETNGAEAFYKQLNEATGLVHHGITIFRTGCTNQVTFRRYIHFMT